MVVSCRTPHLLKTGKSVAVSKNLTFTNTNQNIYRNYSNYTLNVVLSKKESILRRCCSCRTLHSSRETPRSNTITKLSPQELIVAGIAGVRPSEVPEENLNLRVLNLFHNNINSQVDLKTAKANTLPFEELSQQLRQIDIVRLLADTLVDSQSDLINNLQRSLSQNSLETPSDVIGAINSGIRLNLLIQREETVSVDTAQLQKFLLKQTRSFIRTLYPTDFLKQLVTYAAVSSQINNVFKSVEPLISEQSLPLSLFSDLSSLVPSDNRLTRSILSDIQEQLSSLIQSTVSGLLSPIESIVNNTLSTLQSAVLGLYSSSESSNSLVNALTSILNTVVVNVAQLLEDLQGLVGDLFDGISSSLSSLLRKRREVEFLEEDDVLRNIELSDDTALVRSKRSIGSLLTTVLAFLWKIISIPLNLATKSLVGILVTKLVSYLTTFLEDNVTSLLDSLINAIFPCSSCS